MEKLIEQMDDEFGKSVHPQALELEKVLYIHIPFICTYMHIDECRYLYENWIRRYLY